MVNILITGGAGCIGSALAERLIKEGHNVTIYDSLMYGQTSLSRLDAMLERGVSVNEALLLDVGQYHSGRNFSFVKGDTRDYDKLKKLFSQGKFDVVFHFGELVGIDRCGLNSNETRDVNAVATAEVVDLTQRHNAAFVYNSTSSLYGDIKDPRLLSEDAPLSSSDEYCANKLVAERHVFKVAEAHPDFRWVMLRPATVGGLSPRMRLDLLPNHFTYMAVARGYLPISNPDQSRAVVDIADLIDAYALVLRAPSWQNGIYNIGHHNLTKRKFLALLAATVSPLQFHVNFKPGKGDMRSLNISSDKFSKSYGYSPKVPLEDTITAMAGMIKKDPTIFDRTNFRGVINTTLEKWEASLN
ncbi:NAD(P)-dependent oxidoreductase [Candidatus Woesearchaeota archaeon]|nr:NAD(P)-dependent oxidoreductase [Candidatus Woesearchaeota archaeon]